MTSEQSPAKKVTFIHSALPNHRIDFFLPIVLCTRLQIAGLLFKCLSWSINKGAEEARLGSIASPHRHQPLNFFRNGLYLIAQLSFWLS